MNLKGYNDSPVENLGSCIVYLYHGNKMYRVLCEVADSKGHVILGRKQALDIEYVSFPEIQKPAVQAKTDRSIKTLVEEPAKTTNGPVIPRVQKCTDPVVPVIQKRNKERITINGKTHSLPTTKDYLLQEYADVFQGRGTLPGGPYRIQLKEGYKPVQHPPRHVAVSLKLPYKAELERLTQLGVIKEVREHTEWINSIVPVKKPDGSLRLCLDPKDLNQAIKRNQWYSRTVDDILPELADSKYFSLLDAKSGYWHVPLDKESSFLTTFNTPWGKYRWLRLPFGLKVAGDVFQERIDRVLRNVPNSAGIVDDILCHGNEETTHDAAVITLLETARANNLTFNANKFVFKSQDCAFFGGHLTPAGYKMDPKKVQAISEMKPPENLQDLQSFLGLVNYLNRFSPALADLTAPLRALCKKDTLFTWESSQQAAFEAIKKEITSAPVLAYFDQSKASTIQSDASKKGLGAVLLQDDKPVIYASRALTETERYSNIERELLSVVFALERFHHYVYGYTATVQTDHKPLVSVWKKSIVCNSPRLQRLLLRLSQYDVNIEYLKGKDNVIADALSRVSPQPAPKEGEDEEDFIPVHMLTEEIPFDSTRIGDFRNATAEDTTSGLLMHVVANGWPEVKKDCHPFLLDYWTHREEISAENGLLFKGHRLIVPEKLRDRVLQTIHEGHFGFEKMQLRAREAVFWPGITSDLLHTAQSCEACQTFSRSQQRETLLPHEVPQGPWEKLGIDFFEFQSITYLLIADYYSRFPVVRKVRSTNANATTETLKQVFSEYGVPQTVMTDNGPPFSSKEFAAFANQYCFDHVTSSPRYPQSNGFIERMVQTVKQSMRKCAAAGHDPNLAMLVYRATPLTTSIPSPGELLNGRKYRALLPRRSPIQSPHCQVVREQMVKDKEKMCEHYNKTARDLPSLPQNQKVYVRVHPQSNQWTPATVTKTPLASQPRSYSVETANGAHLVRNRRCIRPAPETAPIPAEKVKRDDSSSSERPRRVITRPKRLTETI